MKDNKKIFILTEVILAALVLFLVAVILWEKVGDDRVRVSVVVQDPDDGQWSAFKYGLKMAAEDLGIDLSIVSTGGALTARELEELIRYETDNGADGIILQPVPGSGQSDIEQFSEKIKKKIKKKVPILLAGAGPSRIFPTIGPDDRQMGIALAGELLGDQAGNTTEKVLGILSEYTDPEGVSDREQGFLDGVRDAGVQIRWSVSSRDRKEREEPLGSLPEVDIVVALDDVSLRMAGEYAAAKELHGALVYGIGHSTQAVYYLDTDIVQCLIVPDGFDAGYQGLTEIARSMGHPFHKMKDRTVSHTVLRRDTLFTEENQEIIFTMSQ